MLRSGRLVTNKETKDTPTPSNGRRDILRSFTKSPMVGGKKRNNLGKLFDDLKKKNSKNTVFLRWGK